MNTDIYQHYRSDEGVFIDLVFDWMQQVSNRYAPYTTVFLTPREAMIVDQLVRSSEELTASFSGGYVGAERQRAVIFPPYYEPGAQDYQLAYYNINFPTKFGELTHGRILGTLLSTGIDRERIGDIITDGESWHIIVDDSIGAYLQQNVRKIANVGVQLEEISAEALLESNETWEQRTVIASSLRLDTLLSNVYNFSRQRAKDAVSSGLVKVNFAEVDRPDIEIGVSDIVSLRKFGRFWIEEVEGVTKKDNYRLNVSVLER
ncbi:RNA-binding protein [Suicoccus acidiformans]|uniref:RNA-binding protein n=1 Tax=Suicoccus acidiformans TaxID=2036206 RepID=A0A347WLL0_9LACT|nr:YlmH/Sll1252 family protein [Suicoccus acidiformans]AXY25967.1 RNA-binding protein [Suicoccus acidiformans]